LRGKDDIKNMFTTLTAWGNGFLGQLGDGTYVNKRTTPVEVSNLDGAQLKAIAVGGHSLALKDDGTMWAWGDNRYGQVGIGSDIMGINAPMQVSGLDGVKVVAAGSYHSLAGE
jgi:alpha-tubulin suppressor-like RCC1 family protein